MKKNKIFIFVFLVIFLISGCNGAEENKKYVAKNKPLPTPVVTAEVKEKSMPIAERLNQFPNIAAIWYASDNKLAILADKLYLFDYVKNQIIAETNRLDNWDEIIGFYQVEGGYVVVAPRYSFKSTGTEGAGEITDSKMECIWLDKKLKQQTVVDISSKLKVHPNFAREVAISRNGQFIAVCTDSGLYLYNKKTEKTKHIIRVDNTKIVASVSYIDFFGKDTKIVFLGCRFDSDGNMEAIIGSINLDGTNLYTSVEKDLETITSYDTFALLGQDIPKGAPSGKACILEADSRKVKEFPLEEQIESTNLWGSKKGSYYGTTVFKENKGWNIRIYEKNNGKMIYEKMYAEDTNKYRDPYLYILDDIGCVIMYFRPFGENSNYTIKIIHFL